MKIDIHIQAETNEKPLHQNGEGENKILQIPSVHLPVNHDIANHNVLNILNEKGLQPTEQGIDFFNLALAVYCGDQLTGRSKFGHFKWSRYFEIFIPVLEPDKWNDSKSTIEEMLTFLSGDKWIVNFRKRNKILKNSKRKTQKIDVVSLFSGGLDSYCGAIDFLSDNSSIALVGHHKSGPNELSVQKNLSGQLKIKFGTNCIEEFWFHVQPFSQSELEGENTQRARSIIFIALGVLVANSISNSIPLNVPENGLISLNIPLTMSRIGSFSTRTTHPYFFDILNKVLNAIGIHNKVVNPYGFSTKGQMVSKSKNYEFLKNTANLTVSCAHPGHHKRWTSKKKRKPGEEIPIHCGNCTPCIIRRAAMYRAGIDDLNEYVFDIIKNSSASSDDLRAFKIALERFRKDENPILFRILQSGPIPSDRIALENYKNVYVEGMNEIEKFIFQK